MTRTSTRLALALSLPFAVTGCPGPETPADAGGTDTPEIDAPGTDAPLGTDAPEATDAPIGVDAPAGSCTVSGYPSLASPLFVGGLSRPLYMTAAPGSSDLFIVEQAGRIRVIGSDGVLAPEPFLDIRSQVEDGQNEQGLLGLAFHPDYESNGLFYVFYTDGVAPSGGADADNVVAVGTRATDRTANPTLNVILRIPDFQWNHNGGCLQFGPDGELYIGTGDGGGGGDPGDNGQDTNELLGKLLRIHVDATTGTSYTIPAGNPFAGATPGADEIFAYGLRNPWRFSFDSVTGDLYIGDVGQGDWEEIDLLPAGTGAGANFGWSDCEGYEGFGRFGATGAPCPLAHDEPILVTSHGSDPVIGRSSLSITGGYVYRGSAIPGLAGAYLFGDYVGGYVAAFRYCDGERTEYQRLPDLDDTCNGLASFAEDNSGELYMVCRDGGNIRRITGG